jgi:ATP adenylyltransferase
VGSTTSGETFFLARNELDDSEFTGPTFSTDNKTLFACIQSPGHVFAITGPFVMQRPPPLTSQERCLAPTHGRTVSALSRKAGGTYPARPKALGYLPLRRLRRMEGRPLWAPWRIEYITGPKDGECVFCAGPSAGDDRATHIVERGERCFTMLNAFPYASGHVMVSPYRHVATLQELDDAELLELMRLARRATAALSDLMSPAGFNVGLNVGTVAGAGFADHLHLHVVPRWEGDTNFMPLLAGTHVVPQALDDTHEALIGALHRRPPAG